MHLCHLGSQHSLAFRRDGFLRFEDVFDPGDDAGLDADPVRRGPSRGSMGETTPKNAEPAARARLVDRLMGGHGIEMIKTT